MTSKAVSEEILKEYESAAKKFGAFNSAHEGYAVLLEEVDELWDVVKLNPKKIDIRTSYLSFPTAEDFDRYARIMQNRMHREMMRKEAIQVAAMALRFVIDCCSEED